MPFVEDHDFSAPAEVHTFSALLFDMDGTIIDSTNAIVKHWQKIGKEIGVDPEVILATSHGRRSIEVLEILDPSRANWEYVCAAEGAIPKTWGFDAVEIPGSRALLAQLDARSVPWAIVTSGTRPLVTGWLDVMALAHPKNLVTAEEVTRGKPDPACYRLGAQRLGFDFAAVTPAPSPTTTSSSAAVAVCDNSDEGTHYDANDDSTAAATTTSTTKTATTTAKTILVLEDAPAGVRAGRAAGFKVVALATTHTVAQLIEAGADWIVQDMRSVTLASWNPKTATARIEITNALRR